MPVGSASRNALISQIPELRTSAFLLCGSRDRADDLVQDALVSAWAHLDDFQEGTNMAAWLFTILRNRLRSDYRKSWRQVEDAHGEHAEQLTTEPEQDGWSILADLRYALERLPVHQREAVVLVGAAGMTPAEAAAVCGCEVGTIKSRTHRARARLAELLSDPLPSSDEGQEQNLKALVAAAGPSPGATTAVASVPR